MALVGYGLFTYAQTPPSAGPLIISGSDLGFRIEGQSDGQQVAGTLMVRINGRWVVAATGRRGGLQPVTAR
jgi:hypothetical protein